LKPVSEPTPEPTPEPVEEFTAQSQTEPLPEPSSASSNPLDFASVLQAHGQTPQGRHHTRKKAMKLVEPAKPAKPTKVESVASSKVATPPKAMGESYGTYGFGDWLIGSFKAPFTSVEDAPGRYGIIVTIVLSLLMALPTTTLIFSSAGEVIQEVRLIPGISNAWNSLYLLTRSTFSIGTYGLLLLALWVAYAIVLFGSSACVWMANRISGNSQGYLEVNSFFARSLVPFIVLFILPVVPVVGSYIWLLAMIFLSLLVMVHIARIRSSRGVDGFWTWIGSQVVARVVFARVIFPLFGLVMGAFCLVLPNAVESTSAVSTFLSTNPPAFSFTGPYYLFWAVLGFIF
jgi:hypothetical protein